MNIGELTSKYQHLFLPVFRRHLFRIFAATSPILTDSECFQCSSVSPGTCRNSNANYATTATIYDSLFTIIPAFDAVAGPELLISSLKKPHTTIPTVCHPPKHLPTPPTYYLSTYKSIHPRHYYYHPNLPAYPP